MFKVNSNCLVIRQSCLGKWQSFLGNYSVSSKFRNLSSLFFLLKEPFFLPSKMTSCEEWSWFKWYTVSWLASKEMLIHQFTGCLGKWYTGMFGSFGVIILVSNCHCVRKLRASTKAMGMYSSWHLLQWGSPVDSHHCLPDSWVIEPWDASSPQLSSLPEEVSTSGKQRQPVLAMS